MGGGASTSSKRLGLTRHGEMQPASITRRELLTSFATLAVPMPHSLPFVSLSAGRAKLAIFRRYGYRLGAVGRLAGSGAMRWENTFLPAGEGVVMVVCDSLHHVPVAASFDAAGRGGRTGDQHLLATGAW